jgi:hypothetical protein
VVIFVCPSEKAWPLRGISAAGLEMFIWIRKLAGKWRLAASIPRFPFGWP